MIDLFANKLIDTKKNTNIGNIQYKGCKRQISYELICEMHKRKPQATTFIDLFGGGGAMMFRALDLGYNVIYNELENDIYRFVNFVIGQLKDKTKQSKYGILPEEYYNFVSKEEFLKSKEKQHKEIKDIFNLLYYSFGNKMRTYAFSLYEGYKREGHNMIMFSEPSKLYMERYNFMSHIIQELTNLKLNWREKRLYFANIILKLEGIRVAMEYNKDILNEFKDLSLIELKTLSNKEVVNIINKYTFDKGITIPLKDYVSAKGKLLQQMEQMEQMQRMEQMEQMQRMEQMEQMGQMEQTERMERMEQRIKNILLFNKSYDEIDFTKFNNDDIIIYCFDNKTELLTKAGWKNIKDIKENDYLLSREPNTNILEYVKNIKEIAIDYNGYMYSYEGKNISILVSENHKLFVNKSYTRKKIYKDISIEAKTAFNTDFRFISAGGIWKGTQDNKINILGKEYDKVKFARLLGIFLTDGSINNKNLITITQKKEHICNIIKTLLEDLKIDYSIYKPKKRQITIFYIKKKYKDYFKQFYLKNKRKIPQEFKEANVEVLKSLMEGLLDGDSDKERRRIILQSESLRDDIMEIAYKIGKSAKYTIIHPKKSFLKNENRFIIGKKPYYIISINNKKYLSHRHKNEKREYYKGKLYCCSIEKWHSVLMRRNGKCIWINQCDIPYKNTSSYKCSFDYDKFENWLKTQREKGYDIFVSEYTQPKYTTEIFSIKKQKNMASAKYKEIIFEKLFVN